jgi:hypothetical protein
MVVLISFEYERKCEPIFGYGEFTSPVGAPLGVPLKIYRINNPNVGVVHNGNFYTWHAAKIEYPQGYEVGFGITRDLWKALNSQTSSLSYVRTDGVQFQLPVYGLQDKLRQALNYCRSRG